MNGCLAMPVFLLLSLGKRKMNSMKIGLSAICVLCLGFFACFSPRVSRNRPSDVEAFTPFDSTRYYRRLFADDTEFDIRGFRPLPPIKKNYDEWKWRQIGAINPVPGYAYWECRKCYLRLNGQRDPVVVYRGDQSIYGRIVARQKDLASGFFVECDPLVCYSYIVAVRDNESVDLIDDEKKLIGFMGDVDNMEEVMLHIKANEYWYDEDTLIGGAYKEESDRYLLYLLESSDWPVTYTSVKAILYKTGKFEVISKVTYKKLDEYWIS
jgi:hypothetical protein